MTVSDMIAVHMAHQHHVDLAETGVLRAGDRAAGVIQKPGAVGVFQYQRPVEAAELAVVASEWGYLHVVRAGGKRRGKEKTRREGGPSRGKRLRQIHDRSSLLLAV